MDHNLDSNIHQEPRLGLELVGAHEIFRFAVNMLDDQIEFMRRGRVIIVELREMVGDKFEPFARRTLGNERYDKLAPHYFTRDAHCIVCEQDAPGGRPLANAQIICKGCDTEAAS